MGPLRSSSSRAGPHLGTLALAGSSRAGLSPGRAALDTTSRAGLHLHRTAPSGSSQTGLHQGKVALGKVVLLGNPLASGSRSSSRRALGPGRMPQASGSRAGWHPGGVAPGSSGGDLCHGKARCGSSTTQGPTLGRAGAATSLEMVVVGGAAAGSDMHGAWQKATLLEFDLSIQH